VHERPAAFSLRKGMDFMKNSVREIIDQNGVMVIDGSMSTALEHLGANLNSKLWTARALAESPDLVKQVHLDYFKAGADCGITCSYQATIPGLMANGSTREEAEALIARSVEIFIEARDQWWQEEGEKAGRAWPLCLAGIGPYGAYLADGSEYRGHYGVSDEVLDEFHRRRMEILHQAGADILRVYLLFPMVDHLRQIGFHHEAQWPVGPFVQKG